MADLGVYKGTDLLRRLCGNAECGELIHSIDEMWVDVDANLVLCDDCRYDVQEAYATSEEWRLCVVPARKLINANGTDIINELEDG